MRKQRFSKGKPHTFFVSSGYERHTHGISISHFFLYFETTNDEINGALCVSYLQKKKHL